MSSKNSFGIWLFVKNLLVFVFKLRCNLFFRTCSIIIHESLPDMYSVFFQQEWRCRNIIFYRHISCRNSQKFAENFHEASYRKTHFSHNTTNSTEPPAPNPHSHPPVWQNEPPPPSMAKGVARPLAGEDSQKSFSINGTLRNEPFSRLEFLRFQR